MKKALLALAVIACFMVATEKLIRAINDKIPPAKVGECMMLTVPLSDGPTDVPVQVIANDERKSSSDIVANFNLNGSKVMVPMAGVSYEEIKSYNPRKVKCDEYF